MIYAQELCLQSPITDVLRNSLTGSITENKWMINEKQLPNFIIVGAQKCGTSTLFWQLSQHPNVIPPFQKEINYFNWNYDKGINWYKAHFPIAKPADILANNEQSYFISGEASPYYLSDPEAPKLIHKVSPNAKILISLRDPVEREFSHFLLDKRYTKTEKTFHEIIPIELNYKNSKKYYALKHGLYSENVKRYLEIFGTCNVKIIIFEEWIKNPKKTVEEILKFLNLNQTLAQFNNSAHNEYKILRGETSKYIIKSKIISKIAKMITSKSQRNFLRHQILFKKSSKPEMTLEDRKILQNFYFDDVKNLEQVIGKKLPWKNFETI